MLLDLRAPLFCAAACVRLPLRAITVAGPLPAAELTAIRSSGGPIADTYGELTDEGFRTIYHGVLQVADRFVDLGSGRGQCVLQAVDEYNVASAVGVELSPTRHADALEALAAARSDVAHRVAFLCTDAAGEEAASALQAATVVWVANLCFDDELQRKLAARLAAATSVRFAAVLKPFPEVPPGFELVEPPVLARCSWTHKITHRFTPPTPGHPCARYQRIL